jgi:uncharacterized protein (TIGR03083 family)
MAGGLVDSDDVWRALDHERAALADLFEEFTEEEWRTPSLCTGWTVRDVAAHLTLAHLGVSGALIGLVRAGGSYNRMVRDTAIRQARLPVEEYPRRLRAMIGSRRKAPLITELEPLIDILVHGQDIVRPLGRVHPVPVEPAMAAADRVWMLTFPFGARRRLAGYELVATDAAWRAGSGRPVEGPIASLLMLVTGRAAAIPDLSGPAVADLAAAFGRRAA